MGLFSYKKVLHPVRTTRRAAVRAVTPKPVRKARRAVTTVRHPASSLEGAAKASLSRSVSRTARTARRSRGGSRPSQRTTPGGTQLFTYLLLSPALLFMALWALLKLTTRGVLALATKGLRRTLRRLRVLGFWLASLRVVRKVTPEHPDSALSLTSSEVYAGSVLSDCSLSGQLVPPRTAPPNAASGATGTVERYGGFWRRTTATLIDCAILFVPLVILVGLFHGYGLLCSVVGYGFYCALLESSPRQATVGKQIMRLRVMRDDGRPLGFWHASGRVLAKSLSALTFGVGFLLAGLNHRRQALHDMISGTVVVRAQSSASVAAEIRREVATAPYHPSLVICPGCGDESRVALVRCHRCGHLFA